MSKRICRIISYSYVLMIHLILLLTLFVSANQAKDVCRFPKSWKTQYDFDYSRRQHEWVTKNAKTDFFRLVLSWSPSFCKSLPVKQRNTTFQCQHDDFDLVVHGLWAQSRSAKNPKQHPRNCRNEKPLPLTTIKRYFCLMPDEVLIQSEWEKHGTCAFKTAEEYLTTIENLVRKLIFPDVKKLLNDPHPDQLKMKKAFLQKNPTLRSNQIVIYMKDKELVDVKICYDLKFNFTNCYQ